MAALTADVDHPHKGSLDQYKLSIPAVAADTFYKGALVYGDATNGLCQVSVPAAGDVLLGVCAKQVVAAIGDPVDIYAGGLWALTKSTPTEADVGCAMFQDVNVAPTDNPADAITLEDSALEADDILIGKILAVDVEETTRVWVQLDPGWIYSITLSWV